MKNLVMAAVASTALVWAAGAANASTVLTFEGLKALEPVMNYYDGGFGGDGSGPGPNDGITFSSNSIALIEGIDGSNFQGEPSPDTVLSFLTGTGDIMNVAAGFTTGFSFYYSSLFDKGEVDVYSGLNGTGTLLQSLSLPLTPMGVEGSPQCPGPYQFCPFEPIGVAFSGTAESVDFADNANSIVFDNITLGDSTPVGPTPPPPSAPEPASLPLLAAGIAALGLIHWARRALTDNLGPHAAATADRSI
jgi:hypothetical protein